LVDHTDPFTLGDYEFLERARVICASKVPYDKRQSAVAQLRRRGFKGTPYHCPLCGKWHTTKYNKVQGKQFSRRLSRLLRDNLG
jgi:hypothetical protein